MILGYGDAQVRFVFSQRSEEPVVIWTPLASAEELVELLDKATVIHPIIFPTSGAEIDKLTHSIIVS